MGISLVVAVTDDDWFEMLSGGIRTSARLISGHRPQHSVRCNPVKCFSSNFMHPATGLLEAEFSPTLSSTLANLDNAEESAFAG